MAVELGDLCRDMVTGFRGIVVAKTTWLNGCSRFTVQPQGLTSDGKIFEQQTFDEPQLVVVDHCAVDCGPRDTGGPIPAPQQHKGPTR